MTPLRNGFFLRRAKDITISSTLALALLTGGLTLSGCESGQDKEADYSYDDTTYEKGIRSYIKEVKPGEFKITDEETVEFDKSEAIVFYLDGTSRTISPNEAKRLIDEEIAIAKSDTAVAQNNGYHRSGLSTMLLYGGMGYMLGRNRNNGYMNSFRQNSNPGQYYSNPGTYQKAQTTRNAMRASRTIGTRPSGGRGGFFGGRSSRSGG